MWTKICGIRDVKTAEQVAALRPHAIGLNFYTRSPRSVPPDMAREISVRLPADIQAVGVFVNHAAAEIVQLAEQCRLTMIQLHGDESPELLAELQTALPTIPLWRAWRMGDDLQDLSAYLQECRRLNVRLAGCLIDAKVPGAYGGSGQSPSWTALRSAYERATWPPLILAGGLTPENVADAIQVVQPWGVDVASGVESSPGVKDLQQVARFLTAARAYDN